MNDLGQNAGRIGNLTITSEILAGLLNAGAARGRDRIADGQAGEAPRGPIGRERAHDQDA